jgi:four helix bundle protein
MGTVEEEADETMYWIELSLDADLMEQDRVQSLLDEANEILSITVSSINTARNLKRP